SSGSIPTSRDRKTCRSERRRSYMPGVANAPRPGVALERLAAQADRARDKLAEQWRRYGMAMGQRFVPVETLALAYDAIDRLRDLLVGVDGILRGLELEIAERMGRESYDERLHRQPEFVGKQRLVPGLGMLIRHGKSAQVRWKTNDLQAEVAAVLGAQLGD